MRTREVVLPLTAMPLHKNAAEIRTSTRVMCLCYNNQQKFYFILQIWHMIHGNHDSRPWRRGLQHRPCKLAPSPLGLPRCLLIIVVIIRTVASPQNDLDERHISTDQPVNGDCCQSESDPASCLLSDSTTRPTYYQCETTEWPRNQQSSYCCWNATCVVIFTPHDYQHN